MTDFALRKLARGDDLARLLAARVRAGEVDRDLVRFRARLGDPVARQLHPEEPDGWESCESKRGMICQAMEWLGFAHPVTIALPVTLAADYAERVLSVWETRYPNDHRPRSAIEAARAWVSASQRGISAFAAGVDARVAANSADASAAYAGIVDNADHAANAASAAVYAARAARATSYNASAANAAHAADNAAAAAPDAAAEHEWQRRRLAEYVLGELGR